jgi:hypothetical protein
MDVSIGVGRVDLDALKETTTSLFLLSLVEQIESLAKNVFGLLTLRVGHIRKHCFAAWFEIRPQFTKSVRPAKICRGKGKTGTKGCNAAVGTRRTQILSPAVWGSPQRDSSTLSQIETAEKVSFDPLSR